MNSKQRKARINELKVEIEDLTKQKDQALFLKDHKGAKQLRRKIRNLKQELGNLTNL